MKILALFFAFTLPAAAAEFPLPKLKSMLCPFNAAVAKKNVDSEILEHGGLDELRAALDEQKRQFGPCKGIRHLSGQEFEVEYKEAAVPLEIVTDGKKVNSFYLGMPEMRNDSLEKVIASVKHEPYQTSFYLGTDAGKPLAAFDADRPLSISRSNQIFVLRAARENKLKLSELIPLDEKLYLHSYGILHFWKPGTLLTVDSLLHMMVSEKDLTASDTLLAHLGPDAPARYGKSLAPFLSFREYFQLSSLPKEKLKDRAAVAALLPSLAQGAAPARLNADRPDLVGVLGWFASAKELCDSALAVKDDILGRNARLNEEYRAVQPKNVAQFGVVQARDSGVSQLTEIYQLAGAKEWRCLSLTVNHSDEVEEGYFSTIAARLTRLSL
ncbi:MAG: serine hydrolase [Bdellovibrionota bacterium]